MIAYSEPAHLDVQTLKARQKATWESGNFGEVAKFNETAAKDFMGRIELRWGARVLDVACGTGNLALIAARRGCQVHGLDLAANLIAQARERARLDALNIEFTEGDAEAMPYGDASFDAVVSMFGVEFVTQPERVVSELCRVTKRGGLIALASWTADGFIGQMFKVFARHLPPAALPAPQLWGNEELVHLRFAEITGDIRLTRRMARLCYPFDPAGTVQFFRRYHGPTQRAFEALPSPRQLALARDLIELQTRHNVATRPDRTETAAEYLEVHVRCA